MTNRSKHGVWMVSFGIIVALGTITHADSNAVPVSEDLHALASADTKDLQCLICVYYNGSHALLTANPELCQGQENCEQNNCRACGEESECHDEPQPGPCHVRCDCSPQEEEEVDLLQLDAILADNDMATLAAMIAEGRGVEFNAQRQAVQVIACGGVVRHSWLNPAATSALTEMLDVLNQ